MYELVRTYVVPRPTDRAGAGVDASIESIHPGLDVEQAAKREVLISYGKRYCMRHAAGLGNKSSATSQTNEVYFPFLLWLVCWSTSCMVLFGETRCLLCPHDVLWRRWLKCQNSDRRAVRKLRRGIDRHTLLLLGVSSSDGAGRVWLPWCCSVWPQTLERPSTQ